MKRLKIIKNKYRKSDKRNEVDQAQTVVPIIQNLMKLKKNTVIQKRIKTIFKDSLYGKSKNLSKPIANKNLNNLDMIDMIKIIDLIMDIIYEINP
jgi:phosphoglucomutase